MNLHINCTKNSKINPLHTSFKVNSQTIDEFNGDFFFTIKRRKYVTATLCIYTDTITVVRECVSGKSVFIIHISQIIENPNEIDRVTDPPDLILLREAYNKRKQ